MNLKRDWGQEISVDCQKSAANLTTRISIGSTAYGTDESRIGYEKDHDYKTDCLTCSLSSFFYLEYEVIGLNNELYHYGVLGMKWGVRRKNRVIEKEKRNLIEDSKTITAKAEPGKTRMVPGRYYKKSGQYINQAIHLVDEYGKVKLSYIRGTYGDIYIASGKDYIQKNVNLNQHFWNTKNINIEYDVYD